MGYFSTSGLARQGRLVLHGVVLASSLLIAACGGSAEAEPETNPDSGTDSAHWQATTVTGANGAVTWLLYDPEAPTRRQVLKTLTAAGSTQLLHQRSVDTTARTVTVQGPTFGFIVDNGQVWRADLRGGQSHQPVAIASVPAACGVGAVYPLDAAGTEAWLAVSVAGAEGNCDQTVMVRSSWDGSHSAVALGSARLLRELADDSGHTQALLAVVPAASGTGQWLRAYDTALQALPELPLPAGVSSVNLPAHFLGLDGAQGGSGYVYANGQVRRLRWSDGAVSLDGAALYDFLTPPQAAPVALPHSGGLYLADGTSLVNVAAGGGSTLLGTLWNNETVVDMAATSTHLVVAGNVDSFAYAVQSVPLSGGTPVVLASDILTHWVTLVGVADDWVVMQLFTGEMATSTYQRVRADGSGGSDLTHLGGGWVLSATTPLGGRTPLHSVLGCTAPTTVVDIRPCGPGAWQETDVLSLAVTQLGELGASHSFAFGQGVQGLPVPVQLMDQNHAAFDLLSFQSGVAGSLQRLSDFLP